MSNVETALRIAKLREEINHHNHRYHVLDDPLISDAQYDVLMQELRTLEAERPELVTSDSPTQRVGATPQQGFAEVVHPLPMLSLGNAFDTDELYAWHQRAQELLDGATFDMVCELKIDGLAVALTYEDRRLVRGATRGNGTSGEDVTANLRTIRSIPLAVIGDPVPQRFEVRGEVFFPKSGFDRMNDERVAQGEPPYANPRNTAAGSLRQLDPRMTASRPLDIFVYALGYAEGGDTPDTHWKTLQWMKDLGFKTNPVNAVCHTLEEVEAYYRKWVEEKEALDYGVDGVVVKVDPLSYQRHMGIVGREPRWAIAYKFPSTQEITRLNDIGINVGRTGSLNPYAILEPVNVGGVTVKMATLHNEDDIRRKDIRKGDWVTVERAGEVIPRVVAPVVARRTGKERKFRMPKRCPVCREPVVRPPGEAMTYCVNSRCPAQFARLLMHFVGREAMDVEGMGEKLALSMLEAGLVADISDLYYVTRDQLLSLDRMADKSADNILKGVEQSKGRPLPNVIFGLGIRHVGIETADALVRHFGSLKRIVTASEEELAAVPGIGPKIAESVTAHFQRESNKGVVEKLRRAGVRMEAEAGARDAGPGPLDGMRFVVTGRLSSMSRSEAEGRIKEMGGAVGSSVSKKTTALIVGEDPGSKADQAASLGTQTLDEEQFIKLLEGDTLLLKGTEG